MLDPARGSLGRALLAIGWLWSTGLAAVELEPLDCVIEPHVTVELSSSETGLLAAVHVDKADRVSRGQLLAELDTQVERAALALSEARAEAEAEIELLRQTLEYNNRRKQRNKQLHAKQAVPEQVLDEASTEQRLAQLRLRQALENHEIARLEVIKDQHELDRRNVRSPIDGVVVERHKTAGEYVEGDPIVRLARLDPLRVEVVVPIAMLHQVAPGMVATVYSEFDDSRPYRAEVTRIDPIVDARTATLGIRLELPNPDGDVLPGLKCRVVLDGGATAGVGAQDAAPAS